MMVYLIQAFYVLTILWQASGQVRPCSTHGRFGPSCKYNCHCERNNHCNNTGFCVVPCQYHFFGPGCQFGDMLSWEAHTTVPRYLLDNNHQTCNPQTSATSVEVRLRSSVIFSWYQIVAVNSDHLTNFNTTFDAGLVCHYERKFVADRRTVDVTCDLHVPITRLLIAGRISPFVCTIYINIGRNLALREVTRQSSTYENNNYKYGPQNAVDDDSNRDMSHYSCTATALEMNGPWWSVNFTWPVLIHFIKIHNRDGDHENRLNEFSLITYTSNGTEINMYIGGINRAIQTLVVTSVIPVSYIIIYQSRNLPYQDRALTLCEVEIYGDYSCPDGKFGILCEQTCKCNKTEVCNGNTGVCASACPPGFYGFACSSRCNTNCIPDICEFATGKCFACRDGYTTATCSKECRVGTYGRQCHFNCSQGCAYTCNHVTGYCICKRGYLGLRCEECDHGFIGDYCNISCSSGCENGTCDMKTMNCSSCKSGFVGDTCQECTRGLHGQDCDKNCPLVCSDSVCNKETGKCWECKYGLSIDMCQDCPEDYYGILCNETCSANCANGTCDRQSGKCAQCLSHFVGDNCSDCPENRYGEGCSLKCSGNCLNEKCEKDSGRCSQCAFGYSGDNCEVDGTRSPYWLLMYLLIILAIAGLVYFKKPAYKGSDEE